MRSTPPGVWRALQDAYRHRAFPLDLTTVKRLLAVTYFFTYALLLVVGATRGALNDATRALPGVVRPPSLVPIDVAFGLPRSVSMGLLSLATAVTAVLLLAAHDLVAQSDAGGVVGDRDWPLGWRERSLSVLTAPAFPEDRFPRLPGVDHPFGEDDAERDEPSLEEVFHHGGPGARLRPDWETSESGIRTPRLRVDAVQVPTTDPETVDTVQVEEEEEELEGDGEGWPGDWHSP